MGWVTGKKRAKQRRITSQSVTLKPTQSPSRERAENCRDRGAIRRRERERGEKRVGLGMVTRHSCLNPHATTNLLIT